ncbi:MAG: GIY-YIG nuclease family protein [Nitrospinota bacterium]|nr:GIY-YIG nuclease family protein [Nitrospinota bacterium]
MERSGGLYVVVLSLPRPALIKVGALGKIPFGAGTYMYVGSAIAGLERRIARHKARQGKKLRWHIDYLRQRAKWMDALTFSPDGGECALARRVVEAVEGEWAYPRFGASDCRCRGHLAHAPGSASRAISALRSLGGRELAKGGGPAPMRVE